MIYWKSSGTITFQGRDLPAAELKAMVLERAIVIRVPVEKLKAGAKLGDFAVHKSIKAAPKKSKRRRAKR